MSTVSWHWHFWYVHMSHFVDHFAYHGHLLCIQNCATFGKCRLTVIMIPVQCSVEGDCWVQSPRLLTGNVLTFLVANNNNRVNCSFVIIVKGVHKKISRSPFEMVYWHEWFVFGGWSFHCSTRLTSIYQTVTISAFYHKPVQKPSQNLSKEILSEHPLPL